MNLGPQAGPQSDFLSCTADLAVYGGAAGGGKSYALLLEPLRHYDNSRFGAVIFRRNSVQVRNQGGLWDESMSLYSLFSAHPREAFLEWEFPSGMTVKFSHLEHERTVYDWQGSQIALIGYDELTHFTEKQFFYMLSRNRSSSGVPGYVRAGCNPDSDSWVRKMIDWWIGEDGFPIPERSGVLRYFLRQEDTLVWADSREELLKQYGTEQMPKSFTFIPSKVQDNKILMEKDPSYLSNLMALPRVERLRLLGGNWNVRAQAGLYFQREYFEILDALPSGYRRVIRYWDRAATKPSESNPDPDWSVGVKLYSYPDGTCVVGHVARMRGTPLEVERFVRNTATQDGPEVWIGIEQDPGSAGVADADNYVRLLRGYVIRVRKPTKDKITRALPVSAQAERGNVKVLRGAWNDTFLNELESFSPDCAKDDQVDGLSGAYNEVVANLSILDVL